MEAAEQYQTDEEQIGHKIKGVEGDFDGISLYDENEEEDEIEMEFDDNEAEEEGPQQ